MGSPSLFARRPMKVTYRWNAGWTVAARWATVRAKTKEQPALLPVFEFQNDFLLFEAKKFSYKTVIIFTNFPEVQAWFLNLFQGDDF